MEFGAFSTEVAREMYRRTMGSKSGQRPHDVAHDRTTQNDMYYVKLRERLEPATNVLTGYTQASAQCLRYVQPADDTLDIELSSEIEDRITVTNRMPHVSEPKDAILLVKRNGSEFTAINTKDKLQVIFTSDLFAAVNTKRDPSTGTARILLRKDNGDLTLSTGSLTIINRFMHISINRGVYGKVEWQDGEWQPYAADCDSGSSSGGG